MKHLYKYEEINPLLTSKSENLQTKALDMLLDAMKRNRDVSGYFIKVFQISDTRNISLKKRINIYFLNNNFDTKLLILTTNTLLKDLNDTCDELRDMAMDFVGKLKYVDEFFVKNIVKIAKKADKDVRKKVARCMSNMFDNDFFVDKYDLSGLLREMLMDNENIHALQLLYQVCDKYYVKTLNELIAMLCTIDYSYECKLLVFLIIDKMLYREEKYSKKKLENVCCKYLLEPKLETCYLASKILIKLDRKFSQVVYDNLRKYFKHRTNKSFYLLEFIRELILEKSRYDFCYKNEDFMIYHDEPIHIKRIKLDILCVNFNDISINEIKKCKSHPLLMYDCLFLCLQNNLVDVQLLQSCFVDKKIKTIKVLYICLPFSEKWKNIICQEIAKSKPKQKYASLYFHVLADVLKDIKVLDKIKIRPNEIDMSKFFLTLFFKKVIDYSKLLELTKNSALANTMVLNLSKRDDPKHKKIQGFCANLLKLEQKSALKLVIFDIYKSVRNNTKEHNVSRNVVCISKNLSCKDVQKTDQVDNVFYEDENTDISYKLYLKGYEMTFEVVRINKPIWISIKPYFDRIFYESTTIKLFELNAAFCNREIVISTEKSEKRIQLRMKNCTVPHEIDLREFNEKFILNKNYEIIDAKYFTCNTFAVDENIFCFRFVNNVFYAMSMSGQVVIKCENKAALELLFLDLNDK